MKKRSVVLLAGLIALAATAGIMLFQPSETVAAKAAKGEVQLEFTVATPLGKMDIPEVVETVRLAVSNIGSSGQDGYSVDSFFDITVRSSGSFDTEILSMDLS